MNKCYNYDNLLDVCLIFGVYCDQDKNHYCYREHIDFKEELKKINKGGE